MTLLIPLAVYFVFCLALMGFSAWARDRWNARKNRAWRK